VTLSNFKMSVSVHRLHLQDSGYLFIIFFILALIQQSVYTSMAVDLCRLSLLSVTTKKVQCTLKGSDSKMCRFRPPVFCFKLQTRFRQILTEQRRRHIPQESRIEAIFLWSTKSHSRLLSISLIICHDFVIESFVYRSNSI
jgi:hypothetical protein